MMKRILKVMISGMLAIAILSLAMCFYDLLPAHIENKSGNTDYVRLPNSIWLRLTEGISYGRFDENGFNNPTAIENPDIIVVGSSHMEALYVKQNKNVTYLLNEKLEGKYSVYNMGVAGHNFMKACQYLPKSLTRFHEIPRLVLIEASSLFFTKNNLDEMLSSDIEKTQSYAKGAIALMQKSPFLLHLYRQIVLGLLDTFMPEKIETALNEPPDSRAGAGNNINPDPAVYDVFFNYLAELEKEYGTQIVIFNHPAGKLQQDGTISFEDDPALPVFAKAAENYDITFVDMTGVFEKMYYEEHKTAHGFVTGDAVNGHLNAAGHAAIADTLYDVIEDFEKEGLLCK